MIEDLQEAHDIFEASDRRAAARVLALGLPCPQTLPRSRGPLMFFQRNYLLLRLKALDIGMRFLCISVRFAIPMSTNSSLDDCRVQQEVGDQGH
jgi:hypothetical protein